MKVYQILLLLFFFGNISAQNLVKNPSFEDYINCPKDKSELSQAKNWSTPTKGTSDYFNKCSKTVGYHNFAGYRKANSGNGYAGFYAFSEENYREYVQGELKTTLIKGETYSISFFLSLSEYATYAVQNLGISFRDSKRIDTTTTSQINTKLLLKRNQRVKNKSLIIKNISYKEIYNSFKKHTPKKWFEINFTYKAKGFEKFFILGNFNSNLNTKKLVIQKSKFKPHAYYYIDDIKVEKTTNHTPLKYQPEKTYTFKNVLFDFDKAILLNVSVEELNKLYQHLETNKHLNIEISGHTDNVGLKTRNKELSLQRAKAVSMYLIKKGLDKNRIKWFGFGGEQPVVKNDSEENRAKNRRVDFKLIKK